MQFLVTALVAGWSLTAGSFAEAAPIVDRYVTIQPIRVCDNAGANCAPFNTYSAETTKIYTQAGVAPVFLASTTLNSTAALTVSGVAAINVAGNGQHPNGTTVNLWFVNTLTTTPGNVLYGEAYVGGNGVVINGTAVTTFNNNVGRLDTVAHELGHNFGLGHFTFGAGAANNLLTRGADRSVPGGVGDIYPDGAQLSQLTASQIGQIRSSPLVKQVPKVVVDTNGSTPFNTNDFFLVNFESGPSGVNLKRLAMDLRPISAMFDPTNSPPGLVGSPFALSNLSGLGASDIAVTGNSDGSQVLTLTFADGSFTAGDSFRFGIDVDLLSQIDFFGATPVELIETLFSFEFSDGYSLSAKIEADLMASSLEPVAILPFVGNPSGDPPLPPGILDPPDPVPIQAVPSVASLLMLVIGVILVSWRSWGTLAAAASPPIAPPV